MRYVANIFFDKTFQPEGMYNVIEDPKDIIEGLPILVVGWKNLKELNEKYELGLKLDITNWSIGNGWYWTFGRREKREKYERDISLFKEVCITNVKKRVKYHFISALTAERDEKMQLFSLIKNGPDNRIFINNDMLYISPKSGSDVYGLYLTDIEYKEGCDTKSLFSAIYSNPNNFVIKEKTDEFYELKGSFKNALYVIPYLY